jgi:hypothetical protein
MEHWPGADKPAVRQNEGRDTMPEAKTRKTDIERLIVLKQKEAQLKAQIQRVENRAKSQNRKDDTRCKIIIGGALLADAAIHADTAQWLKTVLARAVTVERDKVLLAAMLPKYRLKG